jgi:hypothetical protein
MPCPACESHIPKKQFFMFRGYDCSSKQCVDLRLPQSIVNEIIEQMKLSQKYNLWQRFIQWLFRVQPKQSEKSFTIKIVDKQYKVFINESRKHD